MVHVTHTAPGEDIILMEFPAVRFVVSVAALLLVALQLCAAAILQPLRQARARRDRQRLRAATSVLRAVSYCNQRLT